MDRRLQLSSSICVIFQHLFFLWNRLNNYVLIIFSSYFSIFKFCFMLGWTLRHSHCLWLLIISISIHDSFSIFIRIWQIFSKKMNSMHKMWFKRVKPIRRYWLHNWRKILIFYFELIQWNICLFVRSSFYRTWIYLLIFHWHGH